MPDWMPDFSRGLGWRYFSGRLLTGIIGKASAADSVAYGKFFPDYSIFSTLLDWRHDYLLCSLTQGFDASNSVIR